MIRALLLAAFFSTVTPLLILLQWLLNRLGLPGWSVIAKNYYRVLCTLLRIQVHVQGTPVRNRAVLYVCNHVSWIDILVIGSLTPVAFVAKREVADWPLIGITARLQRTVFVDRMRRHKTGDAIAEIVRRLADGIPVVLFAEGTSSDGNRVLPFRSALIGAIKELGDPAQIQPMAICYTKQRGMPMNRRHRPLVAWYGDLEFLPHIRDFIAHGVIDVVVSYGEPLTAKPGADRKAISKLLEDAVRAIAASAMRGRPPAALAAE